MTRDGQYLIHPSAFLWVFWCIFWGEILNDPQWDFIAALALIASAFSQWGKRKIGRRRA